MKKLLIFESDSVTEHISGEAPEEKTYSERFEIQK